MRFLTMIFLSMFLVGCAGLDLPDSAGVAFTYGTIKKIESGSWEKQAVLDEVDKIRNIADTSVVIDTADIVNSVMTRVGIEDESERFLVAQFLASMQDYVIEVEAPEQQRLRLDKVLDAVERGARWPGI